MSDLIIRTFCWHNWEKWTEAFKGVWVHKDEFGETTFEYMSQKRTCKKCGRTKYRKCS